MEKIYIFGHKNPDTDSVTSSLALEYLKKQQGYNVEARILSEVNDETKFVLNNFGFNVPKYLNDTKLQIKDLEYHKNLFVNQHSSIKDIYNSMSFNNVTGVPIVDDELRFVGIVTAKTLLKDLLNVDNEKLITSYNNILKTLDGEEVLKYDNEINGNLITASFKSTTFLDNIILTNEDILIVGDRHSIIEAAVNSKIKLLIITGNGNIKDEHLNIAKENKVNIIKTSLNTYKTVKEICLSNYAKNIISNERPYTIQENEYYDDFQEKIKKLGFNNYPVIDKNGICKGLIRITDINKKKKKKVILVDHNEPEQSVIGLNETEILEVIDHHNIGSLLTNSPINFRNMAVGSTNTIIYFLYNENRISIPKDIASIMLSGILSDTLGLTSPTTTNIDRKVVEKLEQISGLEYKQFTKELFNASLNFNEKTERELINSDMKAFQYNGLSFKVSQITTMSSEDIMLRKQQLLDELELINKESNTDFSLLFIVDILKNGSYLLYTEKEVTIDILERAFNKSIHEGVFLEGCLSRKKQVIPAIMEID